MINRNSSTPDSENRDQEIRALKTALLEARTALADREAELAQSAQHRVEIETRLTRVFDASGEYIYETDQNGDFTFLSERFQEITGHTPQSCLGKRLSDLVPESERTNIRTALLDIGLKETRHRHFEAPIIHQDKHLVWVRITIAPYYSSQGELQGYCGSGSDITDQKNARAALQESEYLLNLAADMADLGYAVWDEDKHRFVKVSDSFAAIHGVDAETYMRKYGDYHASLTLLHPDDLERYIVFENALTIHSKNESIEYRVRWPSGEIRHVHERYQFLHDHNRKAKLSLVVIQDITDLKETKEKLDQASNVQLQTESRLARIVDASGGFTYECAPNGNVTFISGQFEVLTGHPASKMIGQNISNLVVETEQAAVRSTIRKVALREAHERYFEAPIVHKEGHIVWLNVTIAPYFDEDGTLVGYCGSGIDITSRKERDTELVAAQEKADAANHAKTNFLATMSHEIRTPMNGVLGMAQLLRQTKLDENQESYVSAIVESGDLLLTLLNDILDVSKIEENQLELEDIPFRVGDILTKCQQHWSPRFEQKGLCMALDNQLRDSTLVCGDPTRLYQILQNLLGNALKFTVDGEVSLNAWIEDKNDTELNLRFEVADTGIGIDKAGQAVLFERFAQVDSSIARKYGGSGLGLSICQELVAMMDGDIGVISAPGSGSVFWFTVRLKKGDNLSAVITEDMDNPMTKTLPHFGGTTKVLVAEDNVVNQNVITAFLKIVGLEAELAANGAEAVEAARIQKFDLILMDIQMPELDGLAATAQILGISDHYKTVPIIALTANAAKADQSHYLQSGMTDFIAKPINPSDLFDILEKYVPDAEPYNDTSDANEVVENTTATIRSA